MKVEASEQKITELIQVASLRESNREVTQGTFDRARSQLAPRRLRKLQRRANQDRKIRFHSIEIGRQNGHVDFPR